MIKEHQERAPQSRRGIRPLPSLSLRILVALVAFATAWGMAEITFRLFGYDFDRVIQKLERVLIFYRDPSEPFGEGWYKRSGNQSWTGQPIRTQMIELSYPKDWYADEPVITVEYDADGFRNPSNMRDWFLVVVGDSFTELGNLPQSALFTTILSQHLGKPVRNLGVSRTGTYTQIAYLRKFGKAPSTRHAVCVFFEGNDPVDVVNELKILHKIREGKSSMTTCLLPMSHRRC